MLGMFEATGIAPSTIVHGLAEQACVLTMSVDRNRCIRMK